VSRPVIGIDLGTTNSVVATISDGGQVVIVRNASGGEITPSVVYFEPDGTAVVGAEAVQAFAVDPAAGVALIKRNMGTEFPITVRGQDHTPESISALILRQLAATVPRAPADRIGAVITVPAYFGTREREATYQAGVIAGLDVLELLDEPVAAAAHYGLTAGADQTVLVYDLGGGTFDTTVLRIAGGAVTVLATDGHHLLGGADIDQRLLDVVTGRLGELIPAAEVDEILDDRRLLGELVLDVELAKRDLSARQSREVSVRAPSGRYRVRLDRDDLEAACGDLFDTTAEIIERVLARAAGGGPGASASRIDDVIMVGGSSRIPALSQRLRQLLGVAPRLVEPDLAVAKGAALRAHRLERTPQLAALAAGQPGSRSPGQVTPVAPRAVGILVSDSHDPAGQRTFVEHLITGGTPLPATRTCERLGTILNNQESIRIQVYEQAGSALSPEAEHNRLVLDGELTGVGKLRAGSVIWITMKIAIDGRLTVIAHEPKSGRELVLEAFVAGVVDSAETERLTRAVGRTATRG
jgi:molecular chaperone DnaK